MTASNPYTELVLEHQRSPRNFGALEGYTHAADGANPLCGDSLRIELRAHDERVTQLRFHGRACAITTATASMLSALAVGKSDIEIATMQMVFSQLIQGSINADAGLGELNALAALARYPARRKCALLPFATLRAALAGTHRITTET